MSTSTRPLTPFEVLAVKYGTRRARRNEVFLNYHLSGEPDGAIEMDYYFWILRNEHHVVLVDCGFSLAGGTSRGRTQLADPLTLLESVGLPPSSVDRLILSHAHYDHAGNLARIPDVPIVLGAEELEFWSGPYASREQFSHSVDEDDLDTLRHAAAAGRVTEVTSAYEVVPGIRAVRVGGHTPGQLVVIVTAASGEVMIASDALHYYEELEHDRLFSSLTSVPQTYAAVDVVRDFQRRPGAVVVASHDPLVAERFPALAGDRLGLIRKVA